MEEKEKSAREIQKVIGAFETSMLERRKKLVEEVEIETLNRGSILASITIELQRMLAEIDGKVTFLKYQYNHADNSTYIAMSNVFIEYMKKEVFENLDMLLSIKLDSLKEPIIPEVENREKSVVKREKRIKFA